MDLQKPRMREVAQAVIALAAQPEGFTAADLAERVRTQQGRAMVGYGDRTASYDLRKMRGKSLVERVGKRGGTGCADQASARSRRHSVELVVRADR